MLLSNWLHYSLLTHYMYLFCDMIVSSKKTNARVHTTSILNDNSIPVVNNTLRNNWKMLFEVNFSKASTEAIRL